MLLACLFENKCDIIDKSCKTQTMKNRQSAAERHGHTLPKIIKNMRGFFYAISIDKRCDSGAAILV